jgi:hypothetical protein
MTVSFRMGGRWLWLAAVGLVAACCSSCVGIGTIHSQVLDAQTKQPIAGAVVSGVWTEKKGFMWRSTELVGVKETVTDAEGRFTLPRPGSLFADDESVTVYKFGYVAWNNEAVFLPPKSREDKAVPAQILVQLFPQRESHQNHITFINGAIRSSFHFRESRLRLEKELEREYQMP